MTPNDLSKAWDSVVTSVLDSSVEMSPPGGTDRSSSTDGGHEHKETAPVLTRQTFTEGFPIFFCSSVM
jgi:hypothetical protein